MSKNSSICDKNMLTVNAIAAHEEDRSCKNISICAKCIYDNDADDCLYGSGRCMWENNKTKYKYHVVSDSFVMTHLDLISDITSS